MQEKLYRATDNNTEYRKNYDAIFGVVKVRREDIFKETYVGGNLPKVSNAIALKTCRTCYHNGKCTDQKAHGGVGVAGTCVSYVGSSK